MNGIAARSWASARLGVLALLWGSTFLWIKLALTALSPVQLTLARCVLGALTLMALCFGMGQRLPGGRRTWGHPTISLSAAQLVAASALTALTLPAGGLEPVHVSQQGLIAVVVLGIFATAITFHLTFRIIADEGATNAATVGYLLPVVSVVLGAIVLDEEFSVRVAAGMLVVLVGVGMTRRQKPAVETPQVVKEESVHQ